LANWNRFKNWEFGSTGVGGEGQKVSESLHALEPYSDLPGRRRKLGKWEHAKDRMSTKERGCLRIGTVRNGGKIRETRKETGQAKKF